MCSTDMYRRSTKVDGSMKDGPKYVLTEEAKEQIKRTSLVKFTPDEQARLKILAKDLEAELV
jgi:hypothetical protein